MSDTRTLIAWVGVCLLTLSTQLDAQAQRTPADSLLRSVIARDSVLAERARIVDSLRHALVRPALSVEIARGPLRVRTRPELEARVRVAADSVATLIERRGGSAIPTRVAARVPAIGRDSSPAILGYSHAITIAPDTTRRWSSIPNRRIPYRANADELESALARLVEEIAVRGIDSTLAAWLMVGRVPLAPPGNREASDVYTEFATTESAAIRRCRAWNVESCLDILGVDSVGQSRIVRWYAPSDYRGLMGIVAPPREDSAAVVAWLRCRDDHDEAACRSAARAVPNERVPYPLSAAARFMFLREVLDAGGTGAYDRLLTSTGTLSERFATASREPLETTVRRWVSRVEAARPERMRVSPGLALASLGWAGVLLAFTFTRRHPWS